MDELCHIKLRPFFESEFINNYVLMLTYTTRKNTMHLQSTLDGQLLELEKWNLLFPSSSDSTFFINLQHTSFRQFVESPNKYVFRRNKAKISVSENILHF